MTTEPRRVFLCGVRKSTDGGFTYGVGGWPFVQATLDATTLSVGPAVPSLLALTAVGVMLTVLLQQGLLLLVVPVALFGLLATPKRKYSLPNLRARRTTIGLGSKAIELSKDGGADRIVIWFLSADAFAIALRQRGVAVQGQNGAPSAGDA